MIKFNINVNELLKSEKFKAWWKTTKETFFRFFLKPIIILFILFISAFLAINSLHIKQIVDTKKTIPIQTDTCDVYNASDEPKNKDLYQNGGRINVEGRVNQNSETKKHISFEYELTQNIPPIRDESSGCYIKFYDSSIDFQRYRFLIFSIKGEGINADIDVGVRLALDQTIYPFEERMKRELPSIKKMGVNISKNWKYVTLDLAEFTTLIYPKPLPNPNIVNKVVFFISNEIIDKCSKGTIHIKDIYFEK